MKQSSEKNRNKRETLRRRKENRDYFRAKKLIEYIQTSWVDGGQVHIQGKEAA